MQVLMLEPDLIYLADRRERGADRRDEVWDGVLHLAPTPSFEHQEFEGLLEEALKPIAYALELMTLRQFAVLQPDQPSWNYRIPDISVFDRTQANYNGITRGIALVVEILSPNDESRQKFSFYAARGISEYWLVHPKTRAIEVYQLVDGAYCRIEADEHGDTGAPRLGLTLRTVDGPRLRITKSDGSVVYV